MTGGLRYPLAVLGGFGAAVCVFLAMASLVAQARVALEDARARPRFRFVRVAPEPQPEPTRRTRPELREKAPPPPPAAPALALPGTADPLPLALAPSGPLRPPAPDLRGDLSAGAVRDRAAVPVIRPLPLMPPEAIARGIEGEVTLRFTIAPDGSVVDIEVVSADPPGYFERAAIRAVSRWRYDPQLVDGQPVARPGQLVSFPFTLDEASP